MKYLFLAFLLTSFNVLAIDVQSSNQSNSINCFKSSNKQHLSPSRSKNFPKTRGNSNCYNYLEQSKEIVKAPETSTPAEKVSTGAAILLNPVGAAFWLIDKVVSTGVDKTINK